MRTVLKKGLVIAVDGPSGVGKTTVSRLIAEKLGLRYVDTGAMYRAVALAAHGSGGVDIHSDEALENFCLKVKIDYDVPSGRVCVNGVDYTGRTRTQSAGRMASIVSKRTPVRKFLVEYQRTLGKAGSLVMEGRDIGTVVLPDADIKFFLDAKPEVRAGRRHRELSSEGAVLREAVESEIADRDLRDTTREDSPLKKAEDAIYVDTSGLDIEGVAARMLGHIKERLGVGDIRS